MPFTKPLPHWEAPGIEPPTSLRQNGWKAGIKPPDEYFNYLQNKAYEALKELQKYAVHKDEMDLSGVATKEDLKVVKEELTTHSAEKASLTKAGHVQLSNSITGTSQTLAGTEKAVKDAKESAINFVKAYGIGSFSAMIPSNESIKAVRVNGRYMGENIKDAPSNDWYYFDIERHNELYAIITAKKVADVNSATYEISQVAGVWGEWKPKLSSNIAAGKYTGNGTSIDIYLGFRPKYVKVISFNNGNSGGFLENINNEQHLGFGGINFNGGTASSESFLAGTGTYGILITDGGFVVTPNPYAFLNPNGLGQTHSYIAMR